jgi:hypothetical protein
MMTSTERGRRFRAQMTPNERTRYSQHYAVKRRRDLVLAIAPDCKCAICGEVFKPEELEIDHVNGRTWRVEDVSPSVRAARYWKEHKAGVPMRVLCKSDSGKDGGGRRYHGARE